MSESLEAAIAAVCGYEPTEEPGRFVYRIPSPETIAEVVRDWLRSSSPSPQEIDAAAASLTAFGVPFDSESDRPAIRDALVAVRVCFGKGEEGG